MEESKKQNDLRAFLDDKGRIVQIPVKEKKMVPVLAYLADKFETGRLYSEKEINEIIDEWHLFGDYFILRRLLVDYRFLERKPNGSAYWKPGNEEHQ